ncbi:MAG TPA: 2,3-bisphosphoglycerate-independent phosphoglycerate mutase [Candidatus Paceibacterota bacterium]|nr:2,3-bisphosphoglycerate-independent phosphoglycerate mutase [Candidatus Paceibacterota bacterium]
MKTYTQAALIVLDGWGHRDDPKDNAVASAKKPFFDKIWREYPHALLEASGLEVGLPEGQMGNSEIGHTTIGIGSVMDTDLVRIGKAIENGDFQSNKSFERLFRHVKKNASRIHVLGLLSDGGVHSHQDHLFAFLKLSKEKGLKKDQVVIHAFTDGRDTLAKTASAYLKNLEEKIANIGMGVIGSFGGRYYGMDRAGNWDRIAMAENVMFECKGNVCDLNDHSVSEFMNKQYEKDPSGKIDEYLEHYLVKHQGGETYPIQKHDAIFFMNFRADRARQLTKKILERQKDMDLHYVTMTQYGDDPTDIAFPTQKPATCLAEAISKAGLSQSHISESEKFPHVTFFLNGQSDKTYPGEKQIKIDSRTDIPTHDLAPEMMAKEIVDAALKEIERGVNFVIVNFPNADVVGHTGNVPAIIRAVESVDKECGRLVEEIVRRGGIAFVTADHGNAEVNVDPKTGEKHTAHTTNPVPAIVTDNSIRFSDKDAAKPKVVGGLSDIAPTILGLLGIKKPEGMTGKNLLA